MRAHLGRAWTNRKSERGSVSLWMVTAAMAMIILTGLAVDLGGQVLTRQRVADVAAHAARAGGQQLQASRAIRGQGVRTDPALAAAAARAYLAPPMSSGRCSSTATPQWSSIPRRPTTRSSSPSSESTDCR
jgi:Flp pilus assembly protein TadG